MNISLIAFTVFSVTALFFLAALTLNEINTPTSEHKQIGDTTIGRNSINWAGGIAMAIAVFICFFLM